MYSILTLSYFYKLPCGGVTTTIQLLKAKVNVQHSGVGTVIFWTQNVSNLKPKYKTYVESCHNYNYSVFFEKIVSSMCKALNNNGEKERKLILLDRNSDTSRALSTSTTELRAFLPIKRMTVTVNEQEYTKLPSSAPKEK
ncbi:hypothetical protein STEG23_009562, partial [Scotinomys teguina]